MNVEMIGGNFHVCCLWNFTAGVTPFVVAGIEFSKRIVSNILWMHNIQKNPISQTDESSLPSCVIKIICRCNKGYVKYVMAQDSSWKITNPTSVALAVVIYTYTHTYICICFLFKFIKLQKRKKLVAFFIRFYSLWWIISQVGFYHGSPGDDSSLVKDKKKKRKNALKIKVHSINHWTQH